MSEPVDAQERSICSMYEDGVSLRTLEVAFEKSDDEIIEILHRSGVIQQREGEDWDTFVERIRQDVRHQTAS